MEHDPQKLEYRPAVAEHPVQRRSRGMFFLGLLAGLGLSVFYYVLLGLNVAGHTPAGPLGAVVLKLAVGIGLLFVPALKPFGLGLITSVPVAVLIFVSLCFGVIALN